MIGTAPSPLNLVLEHLRERGCNPKRSGGGWQAKCPAHEDDKPSLSINPGEDGKVLITCHAICSTKDVMTALGLEMKDLFPPTNGGDPKLRRIVTTYDYTDENGNLLSQAVRYTPKDFRQRAPDGNGEGGWTWNLKGVRRVLYKLPTILENMDSTVIVAEGEKDADRLAGLGFIATTNPMGCGKWRREFSETLRGRCVVIIGDNDPQGRKHARQVGQSLHGVALNVRIVELPDLREKEDVSDWLDGGGTADELKRLARGTPEFEPSPEPELANDSSTEANQPQTDKPMVVCSNRELCDKRAESVAALLAANDPPKMFIRNGQHVRCEHDDDDRPIVRSYTADSLRGRLSEVADFVTITRTKEGEATVRHISPPVDSTKDLVARPELSFPKLANIVEAPVLRPDGTLLSEPGYDTSTRLLFVPRDETAVTIPSNPNREDAQRAATFVMSELLVDFPFVDDAARANMLATLLTPLTRPMIEGRTPLAVISAPSQGTGKTLLADLVSVITSGWPGSMMPAPKSEEEWVKTISAALQAGYSTLIFDNVTETLRSDALALVLTAPIWTGRRLGTSEMPRYAVRASWIVTGNNIQPGGDLPRRCVWIKLDARTFQPELRTDFRHPDLVTWAMAHRGQLLTALLTMARAWISAGRPKPTSPRLGSFERWCDTVGGILEFASVPGFLATWQADREASDTDTPQWAAFLTELSQVTSGNAYTASQIKKEIEEQEVLRGLLPDDLADALSDPKRSFSRVLGCALGSVKGRLFDENGLRVEMGRVEHKVRRWRVVTDAAD